MSASSPFRFTRLSIKLCKRGKMANTSLMTHAAVISVQQLHIGGQSTQSETIIHNSISIADYENTQESFDGTALLKGRR